MFLHKIVNIYNKFCYNFLLSI